MMFLVWIVGISFATLSAEATLELPGADNVPFYNLSMAFPTILDALEPPPILKTRLGCLSGSSMKSQLGRIFVAFQGIPYAKAPVGDLRFKAPEPRGPWEPDVLVASQDGPMCIQPDPLLNGHFWGEDDCLVLNVYMPKMPEEGHPLLPVMFFIHGGDFVFGSGNTLFSGPRKLLDKDIVLVTINYRLGALGFLSTEDEECSGNWGLHDQVLALEWVRDNIADYGGDPNEITIFGESAGASSVQYLMLYPRLEGVFKRVIMQSGNTLLPLLLIRKPSPQARRLAEKLLCPTWSTKEMVACLRMKSGMEIITAGTDINSLLDLLIPEFAPVIEKSDSPNAFLTDDPEVLLREGLFHKGVTVIAGVNRDEMGLFAQSVYEHYNFGIYEPTFIKRHLQKAMGKALEFNCTNSYNKFFDRYFKHVNCLSEHDFRRALIKAFSDGFFNLANNNSICYMSKYIPTYMYSFEFRGSFWMGLLFRNFLDLESCAHADDLVYLFDGRGDLFGVELEVSQHFVNLWADFATYGDPTHSNPEIKWIPATCEEDNYIRIAEELTMCKGYITDDMRFWNEEMKQHQDEGLMP